MKDKSPRLTSQSPPSVSQTEKMLFLLSLQLTDDWTRQDWLLSQARLVLPCSVASIPIPVAESCLLTSVLDEWRRGKALNPWFPTLKSSGPYYWWLPTNCANDYFSLKWHRWGQEGRETGFGKRWHLSLFLDPPSYGYTIVWFSPVGKSKP